ncbi:MAG: response regulator [Bacteroidota bacterium]
MEATRIVLIEDDQLIREGLSEYFQKTEEIEVLAATASVEDFFCEKFVTPPQVMLLDINLPGVDGIDAIKNIKIRYPELVIIMLTIHQDAEKVFQAFKNGADGYLLKDTPLPAIKDGILEIKNDGAPMSPAIAKKIIQYFQPKKSLLLKKKQKTYLTEREKEVVKKLVDGLSYKQVANELSISIETVRHHIKNIYSKLQVNSKSQVVSKSLKGDI